MLFPAEEQEEVAGVLVRECGYRIPGFARADAFESERIRFALLKISDGTFWKLTRAIDLAKMDLRDVLVEADFGVPGRHLEWMPEQRRS